MYLLIQQGVLFYWLSLYDWAVSLGMAQLDNRLSARVGAMPACQAAFSISMGGIPSLPFEVLLLALQSR